MANTTENLITFTRAVSQLSPSEERIFFQYFVGALSTAAPKNDWSKAIQTASQLVAAGKESHHV